MKTFLITLFAIAMGFLEAAVVIYIRELMYPGGFDFPLTPIPPDIAMTEILREASTLILLGVIGFISGKYFLERFAWFIYCFAIWDIFYYVFLKWMIGWPESLLTWDILFLIPVTWTGPVITPVITSLSMIALAWVILHFSGKRKKVRITFMEWTGLFTGVIILFLSYIWDYSKFMLRYFSFSELFILPDKKPLFDTAMKYIPEQFNWFLFVCGQGLIVVTTFLIYKRLSGHRFARRK